VIDFDMGFNAPYGYDLITAIYHTYSFPPEGIAEYSRWYVFSESQEKRYLAEIDSIARAGGLPNISEFAQDFLIGRLIWAVVRMHAYPQLQRWRYSSFEKIIDAYLNDVNYLSLYKG
jgi:hypothetical protein